jgi:hypothetical protein
MAVSDMLNQVNYYKILSDFKNSPLKERDPSNARQSICNLGLVQNRPAIASGICGLIGVNVGAENKRHLALSGKSLLKIDYN